MNAITLKCKLKSFLTFDASQLENKLRCWQQGRDTPAINNSSQSHSECVTYLIFIGCRAIVQAGMGACGYILDDELIASICCGQQFDWGTESWLVRPFYLVLD